MHKQRTLFTALMLSCLALSTGCSHQKVRTLASGNDLKPCGIHDSQSIEQKIAECETHKITKQGWVWSLVTRLENGAEVWRDEAGKVKDPKHVSKVEKEEIRRIQAKNKKFKHYWSDIILANKNFEDAKGVCKENESLDARGHLKTLIWSLPSGDPSNNLALPSDYIIGEEHGMREVIPNMRYWLWTSSVQKNSNSKPDDRVWLFFGYNGTFDTANLNSTKFLIHCVGKKK